MQGPDVYSVSLRYMQMLSRSRTVPIPTPGSYLDSSVFPPTRLFNHEGALIPPHWACGGYSLPFFSTLGSQVHHLSSGTLAKTEGTWLPQPRHAVLAGRVSTVNGPDGKRQ